MQYAPSKDRNGHDLHPGDRVRFKIYPKGSAVGIVVISKRTLEVLPDGKTAPALAIDSDGTIYGMPPPKGVARMGAGRASNSPTPTRGRTMIRKSNAGYTVYARSGRPMGTYPTLNQAHVRLGQLEAFKENRAPQMSPTVRKKGKGYYVRAKSGRNMGWYATKREALMRKGQLEANGAKFFKETRGYTRQGSPKPVEGNFVLMYFTSPRRAYYEGGGRGFTVSQPYQSESAAIAKAKEISLSSEGEVRIGRLTNGRMLEYGRARKGVFHKTGAHSPRRSVPNRSDLIAALGLEPEGRSRGQKYDFTTLEFWKKIQTHNSEAARRARRVLGLPEPRALQKLDENAKTREEWRRWRINQGRFH
jgi:hypothetical protein